MNACHCCNRYREMNTRNRCNSRNRVDKGAPQCFAPALNPDAPPASTAAAAPRISGNGTARAGARAKGDTTGIIASSELAFYGSAAPAATVRTPTASYAAARAFETDFAGIVCSPASWCWPKKFTTLNRSERRQTRDWTSPTGCPYAACTMTFANGTRKGAKLLRHKASAATG